MLRLRSRYAQHERGLPSLAFRPFALSVTAVGGEVEGRTQRIVLTWTRYYCIKAQVHECTNFVESDLDSLLDQHSVVRKYLQAQILC